MEQRYLTVWFDSAFPTLTITQKLAREYFLKHANVDDFRLEVSIRDCSGDHNTFYTTKYFKKKYGELCMNTEEWNMTGGSLLPEIDDIRDELLSTAHVYVRDTEPAARLTDIVILEALENGLGHDLLYDREYREFVTVTCDWE